MSSSNSSNDKRNKQALLQRMKVKKNSGSESSDDESYTSSSSLTSSSMDSEDGNHYANTSTSHLTTTHRSSSGIDDSGYSSSGTSFTISSVPTTFDSKANITSSQQASSMMRESPKKPLNQPTKNPIPSTNNLFSSPPVDQGLRHVHKHFHHYADTTLNSKASGNESTRSSISSSKIPSNMDSTSSSLSSSRRGGPGMISSNASTTASSILNSTPSPNLQTDLNSSTTNSKAILSALQSLQDKIKTLQTRVDDLEREKVEQRNRYEHEVFSLKMKLESERDSYKEQLEQTRNEYRRTLDKLNETEKELDMCKDSRREVSINNNKSQQRTLELERKSNQQEKELLDLKEVHSRLNTLYDQSLNKIEELQSNLVKMHRRKDRSETERKELDVALKEMIELHQQFVNQTMGPDVHTSQSQQHNVPLSSSPPPQPSVSPAVIVIDKKKKKASTRPKSAGAMQPTLSSKRKKKEISSKRVVANPVSTTPVTNLFASCNSGQATNVISRLSTNKNLHERLRKSNNNVTPPFLPNSFNSSARTYHIAGQTQNLLSTTLGVGRKDSTNYYGANEHGQDKEHVQLIRDVDAANSGDEVRECIAQLESEYQQFQDQYKLYLNKMSEPECNIDFVKEQLRYLTDAMDRKNRQINSLKLYQHSVCERIRDATSPPKIRGTEKRVQALRLFNDLRKLQQQGTVANHC